MKILFVGPQGSGKSTQGKLLAEFLQIPYISTGDIFRNIAVRTDELGLRVKDLLDKGLMVDDQTVSEIVKLRLLETNCQKGFILDGYPRSLKQIELYDPGFDLVIYLELDPNQAVKRLLKRGREDDTPALIEQRLKLYHQRTDPIIEFYRKKGILDTIDAGLKINKIQEELRKQING